VKTLDHTQFGVGKPPPKRDADADRRWWTQKGLDAANAVTETLTTLMQNQRARLTQYIVSSRLYGNLPISGPNGISFQKLSATHPGIKDRISYNAIQIATDTAVSKVAKNRPKPYFLTSGGDYRTQRKAKKLNKFVDGVFYECGVNELGPDDFRDGAVWGTGVAHVYSRAGRVAMERCLPHELWIDEIEAFNRDPRQLHRVKNVDRLMLAEQFPGHRKAIMRCDRAKHEDLGPGSTVGDLVTVRESWHLPSGPDASDGRHMITVSDTVLMDEEWTRDHFPFAFFHWCKRLFGFWGQGGVEQAQNTQMEINQLMWVAQRSYKLAGSFKILLENGSKVVKEHLNNDIGAIIMYTGTRPEYVMPPVIPEGLFQQIVTHKGSIFEIFGVSTMAARSEKPAGLNSGIALREYKDETAERLMTPSQAYEKLHLDLARLAIEEVKELVERNRGKYSVRLPGSKFMESVDWADIDLDDDQFTMQCYPVSSLPSDPAGRLQTVQEFVQAGFLSPRQGKRLMDFPDLEKVEGLHNASEDYLQQVLDRIVDDGEYTPPEPYDDQALAREMALEYYQQGKAQGLEPERLEMLRTFLSQLDAISQAAQPPMAAPGGPPQPGMGAPAAPAVPPAPSDLVPQQAAA
jgi:hypothetical protein